MNYTAKKQVADSYYIATQSHSWAYFYVTTTGELFIHSDWGYYCYSWKSFGKDFKAFLRTNSSEYILQCLERNYRELKGPNAKLHKNQYTALTILIDCFIEELKKEVARESAEWVVLDPVFYKASEVDHDKVVQQILQRDPDQNVEQIRQNLSLLQGGALKFRFIIPFYDAGQKEALLGWFQVWETQKASTEPLFEGSIYSYNDNRDRISSVRWDHWSNEVIMNDFFGITVSFKEVIQQAYDKYLIQSRAANVAAANGQ